VAEQNPVGIIWKYTLLGKKKIIVQKRRGVCVCLSFSRSSNSFSTETMKLKYRKKNPIRLCTMHYDTGLYSAGCKEAVKHCVRDKLTRINPISAGVLENQFYPPSKSHV